MATAHVQPTSHIPFPINTEATRPRDRRSDVRYPVDVEATLRLLPPLKAQTESIRIVDVSKHGVCIKTSRRVFPGTAVMIRFDHTTIIGDVRYCREAMVGFQVGIKVFVVHSPERRPDA